MKKTLKKVLAMSLALASCCGVFAGCKEDVPDNENTLQLYIGNYGYGTEWLSTLVADFKEEAWVKEKYPNLVIPKISSNSEKNYALDTIDSGTTTIDLFFSTAGAGGDLVKKSASNKVMYENMNDLFASKIPGEGDVTVESKMQENFRLSCDYGDAETSNYMQFPWVAGYIGLLYNEALVTKYLGATYEMPRTTNELVQMAKDLNAKDGAPKAFILSSKDTDYWTCFFNTWWAQYSGLDAVLAYNEGFLGDTFGPDIFSEQGRLETLKVIEECLNYENKYIHTSTNTMSFTESQGKFLKGEGVMMMNGDWMELEMKSLSSEIPEEYEFKFLKTPIISSIVNKLQYRDGSSNKMSDEMLSAVIEAIDGGATTYEGVSSADMQYLINARNYVSTVGGHYAYIPSYSTAKGLAKDFLLYMSTNKAIEKFMKVEQGVSSAFQYTVDTTSDMYKGFSALQKSRLDIIEKGIYANIGTNMPLCYYGGLKPIMRNNPLETRFTSSAAKDRKTAQQIFDEDKSFYTQKDGEQWNLLIESAGLK